jgi:hypothetical protein
MKFKRAIMSRVKELETELKLVWKELYIVHYSGSGFHSRHNKLLRRYWEIVEELEKISLKWKFKKLLRRILKHGKN